MRLISDHGVIVRLAFGWTLRVVGVVGTALGLSCAIGISCAGPAPRSRSRMLGGSVVLVVAMAGGTVICVRLPVSLRVCPIAVSLALRWSVGVWTRV